MMQQHTEMLKTAAAAPSIATMRPAACRRAGGCPAGAGRRLAQLYAGPLPVGTNPFSFVFGPGGNVWSPITGAGGGGPYFGPMYNTPVAPSPIKQVTPLAPEPAPHKGAGMAPAPAPMKAAPVAVPTLAPKPVPV